MNFQRDMARFYYDGFDYAYCNNQCETEKGEKARIALGIEKE